MNLMVRERKEEAGERESETEVKFSEKRKSDRFCKSQNSLSSTF